MKWLWGTIAVVAAVAVGVVIGFNCGGKSKMSDIKKTDPDIVAVLDNFIKNDVETRGNLSRDMRHYIVIGAHVATQSRDGLRAQINSALDDGIDPVAIKEVVYHAIPYVGLAKVYDSIVLTNEVFAERGIKLPLASQATVASDADARMTAGTQTQGAVIGGPDAVAARHAAALPDLAHIEDFLTQNCFGDYYSRNGLDFKTRELLTLVLLVSMGGADAQVRGHVAGNLNVGNGRDVMVDAVTQLVPYIGYPRTLNAISAINELTAN